MGESSTSQSHVPLEDSIPQASLESILCTEELHRRPSRPPDYDKENRALVALVSTLADSPRTIFQTLAETILDITQCDSAGLSLLTKDGKSPHVDGQRFYWPAICGVWNPHVGGGTPRNFGPCGDVLDQNRTLLFRHFERRYPYLLPVIPAAEECLLVPFHVHGKAVGTIWAIMHNDRRTFDAEDDRVMASLGKFASSAYQAVTSIDDLKFQITEREKAEAELRKLTDGLEGQVRTRTAELQRSEERLRLAQQAARIGTFEWNIKTGVNTWTPELEAMYGLTPGGFGGTQTAFENLVHPDDRERVIELDNWALKTGQPTTGEWRVVWSDQSVHWIAGRWQAFMNESGEPSRMVGINIDITDRKLAEQEFTTTSERLRLAMESGSVGGWDYDVKTGKTVLFGMVHAQLGMSPDETVGSREEFWDHVHEDDRERYLSAIEVAREKKDHFDGEFRVVWRDGTIRWLRTRGRYYYAANGEPERLLGISGDITERKHAEQLLRESEQRLRLATQAGRMYAYDWDVTKDVVVRSSEHVKILGLTEQLHLPQQQFVDKIHPDDRPKFLAAIAGLTPENPTAEVTYRALASDGASVWLKSNGRGFFDAEGRLLRVIGMVADVTESKRAEQALEEVNRTLEGQAALLQSREELLKIFVKTVPAGVAMLDREMRYLQVSDRWCADYGVDASQVLGRSHYEVFSDIPQRWKEIHRRALDGETLRAEEDRWDRQGGFATWVRWEIRPWRTPSGGIGGILILAEDITHRKEMEEAMSGMTRKLIESQEQERARIGRELHDDINQRLAMLSLELEQLQHDPSEFQRRVQELRKEMSEISNDVQTLSHDLHSSKLEYLGVVSGIRSWCNEFAERQKMEIDFRNDVSSVLPLAVGLSLFRVLQEALNNAVKHSGVKRIEVQLREDSGEIHLIVRDSGKGFDVEAALQGKGLGLTSMRERARLVNGTISIESKPMGGTTIGVRVPLESEQAAKREAS